MKVFAYSLLLLSWVLSATVHAELYRWVDSKGVVHFGDHVPPDHAKHDREQLNKSGRVVKTYDGSRTPEQLAEERRLKKEEQDKKMAAQKAKEKDRVLVMTYQSVDEINAAREIKITTVQTDIDITESRMQNEKRKLRDLRHKAAGYERASNAVPRTLLEKINVKKKRVADIDAYIMRRQKEQDAIRKEFAGYIARYKELTE